MLCDAKALHTFMRPEARMLSYGRVVAAQISGRAINIVTPFGALGEATKLTMLVSHAPSARVLSSIVVFNLADFTLSVVMMLIGTPITVLLVDLPSSIKVPAGVGLAVLVPLMVVLGMAIHRGAFSTVTAVLHRLHLISRERRERWTERLVALDRSLGELYQNRATGAWKGILWLLGARLATWTSTLTLTRAVGVSITPTLVVGVFSVGVLISWISSVVPLGLGLADGGNYALYDLLGASGAHGAFITMLNRARSLVFAVIGLVTMAVVHTLNRIWLTRMRHKLDELRKRER
jgi:hypothetical protein